MRVPTGVPFLLLVLLLAPVATAPAAASSWTLRAEGGLADYSRQSFSSHAFGYTELTLDGDMAFALAAEYRPSPRFGLELSVGAIDLDAHWRQVEVRPISFNPVVLREFEVAAESGSFTLRPVSFAPLFHPLRSERFDLYIGPQVSWVAFDEGIGGLPDREEEWGFGGKAGFDVRLGQSAWWAGLGYRFLDTQHEGQERDLYTGIGVHVVSAVLSYRAGKAGG